MSIGKSHVRKSGRAVSALAALLALVYAPCKGDVPPPLAVPSVPSDFCGSLYSELNGDLQTFDRQLQTPPTWTPVSLGPTLNAAALAWANGDTGPQISNPAYVQTVQAQLQAVKAMGVQAVSLPILFPILYAPFYGAGAAGQTAMQPYLTFYESVAQAVRQAGLKLIVDDEILFSNDIQAGWTNMNTFYSTLTWPAYVTARATMAATIAQYIQPDFLSVANEPDTEAVQTGQSNLNNPSDAAQMVLAEIVAVQALNLTTPPKLGAGFGTWLALTGTSSLQNYIDAYVTLPLDYIDFHVIPVNTVNNDNFLQNALTVASAAAAAGKAVAVGQAWLGKAAASEQAGGYSLSNIDVQRSRQTFSFWQPLDAYYAQVMETLANYTEMAYLDFYQTFFYSAYQTYGGNAGNGGSANCTCTTSSCSPYEIMAAESPLANAADLASTYSALGFSFNNQLVTTPDTTPPTQPTGLTGTAGLTQATLSWQPSTDDTGVAGYNVYRCTPPAQGQSCAAVFLDDTTLPTYNDPTLTTNTPYNYQVQAYDFANNHSPLSTVLSLQTFRTSADSATNLAATAISPSEIDLSWSPPSNTTGLSQYLIYAGTSPSSVQQVATRGSTQTTYKNMNLAPRTTYYFGIVAMEQGIAAPMSNEAYATTLPLPPPPYNITAAPSPIKIALSWQEGLEPGGLPVSSYQIFDGLTPGYLTKIATTTATTSTVTGLTPNTTYYFEIQAVDSSHNSSAPSNQVLVTTLALPNAPVATVAANSATRLTVTWTESVPPNGLPISSFTVFRGPSAGSLTKLATVKATSLQFIDTGGSANTTYYYGVQATDTSQDVSPMSNVVRVTTPPMPAAPVITGATANSATKITVTFTETIPPHGLSVSSYAIYRGTSPTGLTKVTTRTSSPFIDTGAAPSTTYYYQITASDSGGDVSPPSNTVPVTTPPMPAAPVNVAATANSSTQITVTWTENIPTGGLPISSYAIYRGLTQTGLTKLATRTTNKYIDTGLTSGTTYYYAITASDNGGDVSPMSATVNAQTN